MGLGNGVEPDNPACISLGLQQSLNGSGLVDGFGVGEDQQGGGLV